MCNVKKGVKEKFMYQEMKQKVEKCITKAKDSRAALANFNKALSLDPTLVDAWVRKGVTLLDMDDINEAARCLNEAVRLSPRSFKALYNRGKLRQQNKDYEEALSDLLRAAAIKPQNPTVHDRIGDVLVVLGKPELAEKYRIKAHKLRNKKKTD